METHVEQVKALATTDVYVLLCRYGDDYWSSGGGTFKSLDDAQKHASLIECPSATAWRIIKVSGLPIEVHPGEV